MAEGFHNVLLNKPVGHFLRLVLRNLYIYLTIVCVRESHKADRSYLL